jgi:hypothetical protein
MIELFTAKHFRNTGNKQTIYSKCSDGSINGEKRFTYENSRVGILHRLSANCINTGHKARAERRPSGCLTSN